MKKNDSQPAIETYRTLVENSLVGMVILQDGHIVFANPAIAEMTGYTVKELLSLTPEDIEAMTHPDDRAWVTKRLRERLAGKDVPKRYEFRFMRRDGSVRWVEISASLVDYNNHPAVQVAYMDVTEKVQAKQALRESEERLRTVLYHAPITIFATDEHGIFTLHEGQGLEKAGMKPGNNVGKSAFDLFSSLPVIEHTGKTITGGDVLHRVLAGETLAGITELNGVVFDNHFAPLRFAESQVAGLVGVATEITERRKAEEELHKQKELLQTIVNNIPVMIVFISSDGRTEWVNHEWQSVLGWSLEEAQSRDVLMEMYPDPVDRQAVMDFALRSSTAWRKFRTHTRDGQVLDTMWANVRLSNGEIIGIGYDNSKRKQAEEKIAFQAKLLDAVSNAVIATDPQGRVTYWNPAAEKLYGWTASEALGRNIVELTPADQSREQAAEIMERLVRGQSWSGEFLVQRKDGSKFPAFVSDSPVLDDDGNLMDIIGVSRDITQHKQAEETLQRNKSLLQHVLNTSPAVIFVKDYDSTVLVANRAMASFYNLSVSEVIGRRQSDLHRELGTRQEDVEQWLADDREVIITHQIKRLVESGIDTNNRLHWFETTKYPIDIGEDRQGVLVFSEDITEWRRAKEAHRASEERYRKLAENYPNGTVNIYDRDLRITFVAGGEMKKYNATPSQFVGKTFQELAPPETFAIAEPHLRAAFEGQTTSYETPYWGGRHYLVNVAPLRSADGTISEIMVVTQNITERKQAEEEIIRQISRAETLVRTAARLNRELDLDAVIQAICEETIEAFHVSQCAIALYDENTDWLAYAGGVNIPPEEVSVMEPIPREQFEEIAQAMGPLIIVPNIQKAPGLPNAGLNLRQDVRTVVVSTMRRDQQLVGTLTLGVIGRERSFISDELILLKALSDQAAQAIINAKLLMTEKEQRAQLRVLTARLSEVEDNERRNIARELHDRVGQNLTALSINLSIIRDQVSDESAQGIIARIEDSVQLVEETAMQVRNVMADLHPTVLEDYGLTAALRWYAERFKMRTGIPIRVEDAEESERRPSSRLEAALFRVAQEALTNVARHAAATQVSIHLERRKETFRMIIEDDGRGFDPAALWETGDRSGWGLLTMRERIEAFDGHFGLKSAPGRGTKIIVEITPELGN